ncbi:MAG: hypothetical protein AAFU61_02460 [Pseudomonadota bacterium]
MATDLSDNRLLANALAAIGVAPDVKPIVPNDSVDLDPFGPIFVGTAGNLSFVTARGTELTLPVPVGVLPFSVSRVKATGTTATDLALLVMT